MKNKIVVLFIILITIFINIGCDQSTKYYAYNHLRGQGTINIIGDFFILHYAENDGAFLSAGSKLPQPFKNMILTIVPAMMVVVLTIFIIVNKKLSVFQIICFSCIIGGGASNIFDRIFDDGMVIDFLNFGISSIRTGILNFADLSITFGAVSLLFYQYLFRKRIRQNQVDDKAV